MRQVSPKSEVSGKTEAKTIGSLQSLRPAIGQVSLDVRLGDSLNALEDNRFLMVSFPFLLAKFSMFRFPFSTLLVLVTLSIGCGKSDPVAESPPSSGSQPGAQQPSPQEIVSQFLDRVRRGGQDSGAAELLTQKAQSELARIGRTVQPLGSPDARFQVTRSEPVPGKERARLVQSIWSEPNPDGTESSYEVVWALQQETNGWRISGLAMSLNEGDPPMVVNFEDGTFMAKLLSDEQQAVAGQPSNRGNTSQASPPRLRASIDNNPMSVRCLGIQIGYAPVTAASQRASMAAYHAIAQSIMCSFDHMQAAGILVHWIPPP